MAASTLLVPGTARADVTDVSASVEFDRLSPDRVATITLEAKSESGITGVHADVEYWTENAWVPVGGLPFTRVDGTANDGTWKAEYQAAAHPGPTKILVQIKSADGETLTHLTGFPNCYEPIFADVTATPERVDFDDREVTIRGRLLMRETRDSEPVPAPGITIVGDDSTVRTAADGSFEFTFGSYVPYGHDVGVASMQRVCGDTLEVPWVTIQRQLTDLSAQIAVPRPIEPGAEVAVTGRLVRRAAAGSVPVGDAPVEIRLDGRPIPDVPEPVRTAADGTYRFEFPANRVGTVSVRYDGDSYLSGGRAKAGYLSVQGDARIADLRYESNPVVHGGTLRVTGRLADTEGPIANGGMRLEYSNHPEQHWRTVTEGRTGTDGSFSLEAGNVTEDGYWRVWYADGDGRVLAGGQVQRIDVAYKTRLDQFKTETGPGGTVTIRGDLVWFRDGMTGTRPAIGSPIWFYFMPAGSSTWEYVGITDTDRYGEFEKTFTSNRDGYWTAVHWEDLEYLASNAPIAYVDVTVVYDTQIQKFAASPSTVEKGGAVTVNGLLRRSTNGGAPAAVPGKPVHLYFLPSGSTEWKQMAVVETGRDGRFEKAFTADQDGSWTAWYWGDAAHARSNSSMVRVDVQ
ncbi:hypothetical protein [Actinomadura sp. WMMB 499]|uniref:hypothetical protein n=1 Tax=Actinomadura sp. WMMB 499 TaxID=1219491 RepID=UPI00159D7F13|nr:hypothetical protein [Actinomadura sp. WMMB 499]